MPGAHGRVGPSTENIKTLQEVCAAGLGVRMVLLKVWSEGPRLRSMHLCAGGVNAKSACALALSKTCW